MLALRLVMVLGIVLSIILGVGTRGLSGRLTLAVTSIGGLFVSLVKSELDSNWRSDLH